jgi:hypothetical protein
MSHKFTAIALASSLFIVSPAFAQGPIVVDDAYVQANGNLITGTFLGTLTQPAITVLTRLPVIIADSDVSGPGDLIYGPADNSITVINTTGEALNPNIRFQQKGIFLHLYTPANVLMQNCSVTGARLGVFIKGYAGNFTHNQTFIISENTFTDIDARPSDGKGSYETTGQYNGQAIHIGNAPGVPAMEFAWNQVINEPRNSTTGAEIEFNESGGTASSHAAVHDNYIQGSFPDYPGRDLYGFGGILLNGETTDTVDLTSSFIDVYDNQIVASANYGIAIFAGHDNSMRNNRVVSSGFTASGLFYPMNTRYGNAHGAYNANQYNLPATVFFNNNISSNVLGYIRKDDVSGGPVRDDWYLPGQNLDPESNVNFSPVSSTNPTLADEAAELASFQERLRVRHIKLGVHFK